MSESDVNRVNPSIVDTDFRCQDSVVYKRQNLTFKVDPYTERFKI